VILLSIKHDAAIFSKGIFIGFGSAPSDLLLFRFYYFSFLTTGIASSIAGLITSR
jgi:hypothetical protein